jgi:hypothetical protein
MKDKQQLYIVPSVLKKFISITEKMNTLESFSIFGSSISATWLTGYCKSLAYYLDEDPNRIGLELYKVPILCPQDIPEKASLCIPLAPSVAEKIYERYQEEFINLIKL